jgi:hypothetical protein
MIAPEIFLEHKKGEKVRKVLRLGSEHPLFLIGSSPEADLKISGEGINGCHAVLKYRAPHWYICDISGTSLLKVNEVATVEARIDDTAVVAIGAHKLRLFARNDAAGAEKLFDEKSDASEKSQQTPEQKLEKKSELSGKKLLHQVVVRHKGVVVETRLLKQGKPYVFRDGDSKRQLPAPPSAEWVVTEVGGRTIQQRLVGPQELMPGEKFEFDRGVRKPFLGGLLFILLMGGMMAVMPKPNNLKPETMLDKKSMDVIFNAKAIKQKRAESQKVVKATRARNSGSANTASPTQQPQPETSVAPASAKAAAALTSLRSSGLSALVGKIAKRANRQGIMVGAAGVSADKLGAGRALFSTGTTLAPAGGAPIKEAPGFRVGGVATQGKGGGVGSAHVRDGTSLSGGGVGTGDIVAMVDEETVIDGGLDKDAIAEVIRRNIGQVRYCYERQLSSNPELYGKVLVKFTIGAGGEVIDPKVDSSTLKSAMVEGCMLRRLAAWKFPLPKGGTQVRVSYPFLFKAQD